MQTSTVVVLTCLIAVVVADLYVEQYQSPAVDTVQESVYDTPVNDRSPRTKRGLLLLKKKLLLGSSSTSSPRKLTHRHSALSFSPDLLSGSRSDPVVDFAKHSLARAVLATLSGLSPVSSSTRQGCADITSQAISLGALGLKAAKVGAVGAGVVGAIALKSKAGHHHHPPPTYVEIYSPPHYHHPVSYVEEHSWH